MKMQTVGVRMPIGQLGMIEQAAGLVGQSASQWMRDAALDKLHAQAEGERLAAMEARIVQKFEDHKKFLNDLLKG